MKTNNKTVYSICGCVDIAVNTRCWARENIIFNYYILRNRSTSSWHNNIAHILVKSISRNSYFVKCSYFSRQRIYYFKSNK